MTRFQQLGAVLDINTGNLENLRKIATINGTPQIVNSPFGKSMKFDGTNDYLECHKIGDYTNNFTLSSWIKINDKTSDRRIFSIRNSTNTQYELYIDTNGKLSFYTGGMFKATIDLSDNKWHLVQVVINGSNSKFYIDGVQDGSSFNPTITTKNLNLYIGRLNISPYNWDFKGEMDNVLVFDYNLSSQEILQMYNGTLFDYEKNCVLSLDMSDKNPQDLSGNENNGNSTGTTIVNSFDGGKATEFNGTSDLITIDTQSNILLSANQNMSYTGWFKTSSSNAGSRAIYDNRQIISTIKGIYIGLSNNTFRVKTYYFGNDTDTRTSETYNDGEWHFFSITLDRNGNQSIYIDGEYNVSADMTSNNNNDLGTNNNAIIGYKSYTTSGVIYFDGMIDKFKIYNYVLSNLQIKDLMNKQRRGLQ